MEIERRVKQPKKYENLFEELCSKDESNENAIFTSKAELMIFAAGVGFEKGKKESFEKSLEAIAFNIFRNSKAFSTVLNTIAFADTDDIDILANEKVNDRITIFEEYACAGLEIIKNTVLELEGDNLDNIISLIQEQKTTKKNNESVLDDFQLNL